MTTAALQQFDFSFKAMGAPCEIKLYSDSPKVAQACYQSMLAEIRRLESKYSRYDKSSVTSQINQNAGAQSAIAVDHETIGLLHYAEQLYQQSDGLFDITSGVLRQAWDFKSQRLPTEASLQQLLPLIDWRLVEVNNQSVRLPIEHMEIDFGGYVKEYATDTAAIKAMDSGFFSGLVNLGGDIRAIGPHPDGSPWRVGIQHPRKAGSAIAVLELHQGAIATSGDYERFMVIDGNRYSHLLNPKTGRSMQPVYSSVSVLAESCLIAGSFSTITLLKSHEDPEWLKDSGLPHLLIDTALTPSGTIAKYAPT